MKSINVIIPLEKNHENLNDLIDDLIFVSTVLKIKLELTLLNIGKVELNRKSKELRSDKNKKVTCKEYNTSDHTYDVLLQIISPNNSLIGVIDPGTNLTRVKLKKLIIEAQKNGLSFVTEKKEGSLASAIHKISDKLMQKITGVGNTSNFKSFMVKREVFEYIYKDGIDKWGLPLLLKKINADLGNRNAIIVHSGHKLINSINFIGDSKLKNYMRLLFTKQKKLWYKNPEIAKEDNNGEFLFKGKHFRTFSKLSQDNSAIVTFSTWQKLFYSTVLVGLTISLFFKALTTATVIVAVLSFIYFLDLVFSSIVIYRSFHHSPEIKIGNKQIKNLRNNKLPKYTILCPLYKESLILPEFIKAMKNLDWPKNKLEVLLLLEENDQETINKATSLGLDKRFKILIVPHSEPKTKPKACNYGLQHASGDYVVIYDAEDKPESDQLKKAYIGFQKSDDNVVCLQSKLNYYNSEHNILTRLFTAEYSLWFDLILPGLQSLDTILPLGGTSNHFRRSFLVKLNGWDAFNVTEDCDLGVRLFRNGYKTATINSTTFEEANSKVKNWLRQRSRWIKGYLQTYLVHMRQPGELYKDLGLHIFLFQLVIGLRMVFILINPLLWILTVTYFVLYGLVGEIIQAIYPAPVLYIAVFSLVIGNFLNLYNHMIALGQRNKWQLVKFVFAIPGYWLIASVASLISFYQLLVKPHYWEKTIHGFHLGQQTSRISLPSLNIPTIDISIITPNYSSVINRKVTILFIKILSVAGMMIVLLINYEYILGLGKVEAAMPLFLSALVLTFYQHYQKHYRGAILGYSAAVFGTVSYEYVNNTSTNSLFILYYSLAFFLIAILILSRNSLQRIVFKRNFKNHSNKAVHSDSKIKILIFNWRCIRHSAAGGAEVYLHELAKRWTHDGNKVTLFCAQDHKSKAYEVIDDVEIYRKGGFYTVYFWAIIYYLFKFRSRFDVVIDSSNAIPFFTPLFSRAVKILVIHHLHEQEIRRRFKKPISSIASFIESTITPILYSNCSIVTVSKSSRKDLVKIGFEKEKISIITPCVNVQKNYKYNKTEYPSLVYLGRLRYYKNIDIAIKAFGLILQEHPDARLTIAGDGEALGDLKQLVADLGIKGRVEFTGYIDENKKPEILSKAWVALQPSSYEGWGITVLEANVYSTPVISANVKGLRDSIVDGKTGYLVDKIDENYFAEAISELIVDKEKLKRFSENAKKWSDYFDWDKNAHIFMRIIEHELKKDTDIGQESPVYETIKE